LTIEKVLIIGHGSIGKRHYKILSKFKSVNVIKIITELKIPKKLKIKFKKKEIQDYNPDYIVICSETNLHFNHLNAINTFLKKKIILVEKPIFKDSKKTIKKIHNQIYVGYNLRFHPLLNYLKKYITLSNDKLLSVNIYAGSYLPNWRKNINYTDSYSASKQKGGGVELDLSHEIDYVFWLFGKFNILNIIKCKISTLKISSNDHLTLLGNFSRKSLLNISLNYYSKIPYRKMIIDYDKKTIHLDLIENKLNISHINHKKNITKKIINFNRNDTYVDQHLSIFNQNFNNVCSMNDAINYLRLLK